MKVLIGALSLDLENQMSLLDHLIPKGKPVTFAQEICKVSEIYAKAVSEHDEIGMIVLASPKGEDLHKFTEVLELLKQDSRTRNIAISFECPCVERLGDDGLLLEDREIYCIDDDGEIFKRPKNRLKIN